MIETLLLPFRFGFMQDAFLVALLLSVPAALLSCFVVLKGWSLMGDAISHAVLPGIVLAWMAGLPLLVGAFAAGMLCAVASGYIGDHSRVKRDTVMGVVFSGMFGLGLVLYAAVTTTLHLDHILFGNMLGLTAGDLWTAGLVGAAVTAGVLAFRRDLLLLAFDPAQAHALGLRVRLLHYGLLSAVAAMVVATLGAVGIILAIGLLIAPGAIAFLLARRFGTMLAVAVAITLAASLAGVYASFWLDSAPAPTIILMLTLAFLAAFARATRRRAPLTPAAPAPASPPAE